MSTISETPSTERNLIIGNFNGQNLPLRQISVKEYDLMIASGVFDENDKIELLNGAIIKKMPKGTKHSTINDIVAANFIQILGNQACVRNQNPIWLDEFSEPEPDIVIAKPPINKYFEGHPKPEDILLILEIADSTLDFDRNTKSAAYSNAGIMQYLLLNVQDQAIEDYQKPGVDGYQSKQTYHLGENFSLISFPDISFSVNNFFPPKS